jgi:hypothetical protein
VGYPAQLLSPGPKDAGFEHLRRKSSPIPGAEKSQRGEAKGSSTSAGNLPRCGHSRSAESAIRKMGLLPLRRFTAPRGTGTEQLFATAPLT